MFEAPPIVEFVNSIKLYDRRPAPSTTWHSCRLDELNSKIDSLRSAQANAPTSQVAAISAALLICEAEKLSIEGALKI